MADAARGGKSRIVGSEEESDVKFVNMKARYELCRLWRIPERKGCSYGKVKKSQNGIWLCSQSVIRDFGPGEAIQCSFDGTYDIRLTGPNQTRSPKKLDAKESKPDGHQRSRYDPLNKHDTNIESP